MLSATLLALSAAVLHAGWNLAVKQTRHDRFIALWAQFGFGGLVAAVVYLAIGGMPSAGWVWALASGCVHLPYALLLARAYGHGDFSQVYPIARGGGALAAAVGGVALLDDRLTPAMVVAIAVIALGLVLLAGRAHGPAVVTALGVAAAIASYTLLDSKGARVTDVHGTVWYRALGYSLASAMGTLLSLSVYGLVRGRGGALIRAVRQDGHRFALAGLASLVTYTLVLLAVRSAPVGYVTALRESSVVIAALVGWRMLGEADARRRVIASVIVLTGLVVLVVAGR